MDGTAEVIVIYDGCRSIYSLDIFSELSKFHRTEILALAEPEAFGNFHSSCQIKVFQNHENLPGYLEGLDQLMHEAKVIFCFDGQPVLSFQALKVAEKYKIPFVLISYNQNPFPRTLNSSDVALYSYCRKQADYILALNEKGVECLGMEGADLSKVSLHPHWLSARWSYDYQAGKRFRDYIGVRDDETLLAAYRSHNPSEVELILYGLKEFAERSQHSEKLKLLLINLGDMERIRELAVRWQVSSHLLVMNQDEQSFIQDLFHGIDGLFVSPAQVKLGDDPFYFLSQASTTGGLEIPIDRDNYRPRNGIDSPLSLGKDASLWEDMEAVVTSKIKSPTKGIEERQRRSDRQQKIQASRFKSFRSFVESLQVLRSDAVKSLQPSNLISFIRIQLENGDIAAAREAMQKCESSHLLSQHEQSDLYYLHGLLAKKEHQLEEALKFFEKSLAYHSKNVDALIQMAKVSILNHCDEDAMDFYRKALTVDSDNVSCLRGVAQIYRRQGMA